MSKRKMHSSLTIVFSIDYQGRFTTVSAAADELWGYASDELIGKEYIRFISKDDITKTKQAITEIISGVEITEFKNHQVRMDGTLLSMEILAHSDINEKIIYCIAREATQKKQADKQLLLSEQRFKDLVQGGADLIVILNQEGNYTYVSPNSLDVLGFASEEYIGKNTFSFMHPDDKEMAINSFSRIFNEKKITVPPIRFIHKDGSWRWLDSSVTDFTDNPAINGIVINSRDITEKELANERLIVSEAHLAQAQRFAKMGSWSFDLRNDHLIWSDELYNIFGTDKPTFEKTYKSFMNFIDEGERAFVAKTSKHAQLTGEPFTVEYNITTPTGDKKVIQEHGYGMIDINGEVNTLFGTAQDITEQKKSEQELKDSEGRYRQIVETAQEGIWMSDENDMTTFVNQKMCDMLKYSR